MALEELVLELTDWCPLNCRHCSSLSGPGCRHSLQVGTALRAVEEACSLGARQVSFGGGEPTAASPFLAVLERVTALAMDAEVFTCGVAMAGATCGALAPGLVAELAASKILKLIFSVHGANASTHDTVTGVPGSFGHVRESVVACRDAGILCELNFVPLKPNFEEFASVVSLCDSLGLAKISVLRFVPQGRGLANRAELELTPNEEGRFVADLLRLRKTQPVEIRTGSPFNGLVPGNCIPCRAAAEKVVIQPDGNVIPCEVFKHEQRREWRQSIYDTSLEDVLSSPRFRAFREGLERQSSPHCPVHSALRREREKDGGRNAVAV